MWLLDREHNSISGAEVKLQFRPFNSGNSRVSIHGLYTRDRMERRYDIGPDSEEHLTYPVIVEASDCLVLTYGLNHYPTLMTALGNSDTIPSKGFISIYNDYGDNTKEIKTPFADDTIDNYINVDRKTRRRNHR